MSDDNNEPTVSPTPEEAEEFWAKVTYMFSNYVQFTSTGTEFFILFGERLPPSGKVRPQVGIVLTPPQAIAALQAFQNSVKKMVANVKDMAAQSKERREKLITEEERKEPSA